MPPLAWGVSLRIWTVGHSAVNAFLGRARTDSLVPPNESSRLQNPNLRDRMRTWMKRIALAFALSVGAAVFVACGKRATSGPQRPVTTLVVDNQSSFEMTIYVLRSAERVRLGTARAISETRLRIPSGIVFGATPLRFLADPIGSRQTPVSSEILVNEGDEVHLRIPPR